MEKELAEKKAKEAAEAALSGEKRAAPAAAAATTDAAKATQSLSEYDLASKRAEDPLKYSTAFLEFAAMKESNIEAAVLLGCPNALSYFVVREELERLRSPRVSNFAALLTNIPEGAERTKKATEMAKANNTRKALLKAAAPSADVVKGLLNGAQVSMEDVYAYGSSVGIKVDQTIGSDPKKAYETLQSFAKAVGGTVAGSYDDFVADRTLFDPLFAFATASKTESYVSYADWYEVYTSQAKKAAQDLADAKDAYGRYTKEGGKLSIDDWKQSCAKRSLPLLGYSKHTLNAFATFLKRPNLTPFFLEYKKLLKL
jgi:hypothetical protein